MRQDRPHPCASYPVSYAYTAYSCEYIFISFSRCPRALNSSAAPLVLSPERRWSQLLTHTPAARIPTCPGRLLVRADGLVPPARLQHACLRAEIYHKHHPPDPATALVFRHQEGTPENNPRIIFARREPGLTVPGPGATTSGTSVYSVGRTQGAKMGQKTAYRGRGRLSAFGPGATSAQFRSQ